jgi:hypothetical protein
MRWKVALTALFVASLMVGEAKALTRAQIPTKMGTAWGASAGVAYIRTIPVPSQIGIQNCAASFTDGFPPLTFTPSASGGCPPFGQDFNGILNIISLWLQWASAGGPMPYDATFQTAIGGYPRDALVQSNILHGRVWISTTDNNVTNPDDQTGAAINWSVPPGSNPAGTPVASFAGTANNGAVLANGNTVGNASSNATNRANADCYWLFVYIWNNCGYCSLFNSAGSGVGRGANAAADWNANDAIATIDMRGSGIIGLDAGGVGGTTSRLSGVPVTTGSTTATASILGENLHVLTVGELATHSHSITDPTHTHSYSYSNFTGTLSIQGGSTIPAANVGGTTGASATGITINNTGSSTAHNTVQRSIGINWNLSL